MCMYVYGYVYVRLCVSVHPTGHVCVCLLACLCAHTHACLLYKHACVFWEIAKGNLTNA